MVGTSFLFKTTYQMLLTTERLIIKEVTTADAPFYFKLLNSPGFSKNIGDRKIHSTEIAKSYIEDHIISSYALNGFGFYKMVLQKTDEVIGVCGFVKRDYLDKPDFGYAILPEFEGKGFTMEAAHSILHYGCVKWKLKTIFGITRPSNIASIKLLEKLNFQHIGETVDPANNAPLILYAYKNKTI